MGSMCKLLSRCLPMAMSLIVVATTCGFGQAQQSAPTLVNPVPKEAPSVTEQFLQRLTIFQDFQKENTGNSTPAVKVPDVPLRIVPEVKTCSIPLLPVPINPKQDFAIQQKKPVTVDKNFVIAPSAPSCSLKP